MKKSIVIIVLTLCFVQAANILNAQNKTSQLMFSKSFKGETVETIKKFNVEKDYTQLYIRVQGKVTSGKIIITIYKPDETVLKTLEIDSTSDVNFYQTFSNDKNSTSIAGEWKFKVKVENTEGQYSISIQSM